MFKKAADLVVSDDQCGLIKESLIGCEGVVDVGNQVFAKAHIFRSVLRISAGIRFVHEAREDKAVRGKLPVRNVRSPALVEASEVIGCLRQSLELQDLIEVVKVCCPTMSGGIEQLVDCF